MTIEHRERHFGRRDRSYHRSYESVVYEWPSGSSHGEGYDFEEELCDQLDKLPTREQVREICAALRIATLRELSAEVVNGGIEHVEGAIGRLDYAKLLNSWIATAEETVAAGTRVRRIGARRRKKSVEM